MPDSAAIPLEAQEYWSPISAPDTRRAAAEAKLAAIQALPRVQLVTLSDTSPDGQQVIDAAAVDRILKGER